MKKKKTQKSLKRKVSDMSFDQNFSDLWKRVLVFTNKRTDMAVSRPNRPRGQIHKKQKKTDLTLIDNLVTYTLEPSKVWIRSNGLIGYTVFHSV